MSILDFFIGWLAPHNCLACGAEGPLLCAACVGRLPPAPERCYRCQEFSPNSLTCASCRLHSRLYSVQVGTIYKDSAKDLIWKLKLDGARAAAGIIARRLSASAGVPGPRALVVPVPTATGRQRQRGYDQAKLLARELSRKSRLPYRDCLARSGQTHQHGLSRRDRLRQLIGNFRVTHPQAVRGSHIVLIDDVVTTGATLEAAAEALYAAGASRVEAAVFACP